jgi:hypothetical protein
MEDERYLRGQIYTIRNIKDDTMIYVGSTINSLSKRFHKHKKDCKGGISCITLYYHIVDNDWSDWYIELYEMYPCNNKKELCRREGQVIREIGTINKNIAGRTQKEYREDNKEKVSQYQKEYYESNKDELSKQKKEYYERNKEYREDNKEKVSQYNKAYREDNKEKVSQKLKEWYEDNKQKVLQKNKEKVCCNICGAFSTKNHLPRHQRTKRCMEALNNTTSNIQDCE